MSMNYRKLKYSLLLLTCSLFFYQQKAVAQADLNPNIDFTHMGLRLKLDTLFGKVDGKVTLYFENSSEAIDSIYLHGVNMEYAKIKLDAKSLEYKKTSKALVLFPSEPLEKTKHKIEIDYSCQPKRGLFFIGWNDKTGLSKRQIWTQGQGIDNRHWVPHYDEQTDKLTSEIWVEFAKKYQVVSNGVLQNKVTVDSNLVEWHYKMDKPMSSYLIMLGIGDYDTKGTFSKTAIPLYQHYYPEDEPNYNWIYAHNEEIFDFLEEEIGMPYPWDDYSQVPVQDFQHGAMENIAATIFGDFFCVDSIAFNDRNYTYVNAHELAHQWFGNLVTAQNSDNHWLHEGFATYYQWLSEGNLYGKDFFDWERYKGAEMVWQATQLGREKLGSGKAGSARFYQKGAWVLYMLRQQLGDNGYRESMKYYLTKYAFGVVNTDSLRVAVLETTGKDISNFLGQWVDYDDEPRLSAKAKVKSKKITFEIEQLNENLYGLPIKFHVYYKGQSEPDEHSIILTKKKQTYSIKLDNKFLDFWVINPDMSQLIRFENQSKTFEDWQKQATKARPMLDRFLAIKATKEAPISKKSDFLEKIVGGDDYYPIRAEAFRQLVEGGAHLKIIKRTLNDPDVQFLRMAMGYLQSAPDSLRPELVKLLDAPSYEVREKALSLALNTADYEDNSYLLSRSIDEKPGIPGHKVLVTALLYRWKVLGRDESKDSLVFLTSSGFDFLTRMNAMQAISVTQYFEHEFCGNLFDALFSTNRKLARDARKLLPVYYKQSLSYRLIITRYIRENQEKWSDAQINLTNRIFGLNQD